MLKSINRIKAEDCPKLKRKAKVARGGPAGVLKCVGDG